MYFPKLFLYSTNGTYLNGTRLEKGKPAQLSDRDEISFGERLATKLIPKLAPFIGLCFSWFYQENILFRLGVSTADGYASNASGYRARQRTGIFF